MSEYLAKIPSFLACMCVYFIWVRLMSFSDLQFDGSLYSKNISWRILLQSDELVLWVFINLVFISLWFAKIFEQ